MPGLTLNLILGAGIDPKRPQFQIPEAASISVGTDGSLVALIRSTDRMAPILRYPAPVAVQGTGSAQVTRSASFTVLSPTTFGLVVQAVDPTMPLQISMQLNSFSGPLVSTTQEAADAARQYLLRDSHCRVSRKGCSLSHYRWRRLWKLSRIASCLFRCRHIQVLAQETQIAIALFKGQSVEAYAKEAGISINTARWYVKQIYAKTGVKQQTELVRMLLKTTARS